MSRFDWLSEYLARLQDEHVLVLRGSADQLSPAHLLEIDPEDWGKAAGEAAGLGCRWAGLWGEDRGEEDLELHACFEFQGDYLVLRTAVPAAEAALASHTPWYPAAARLERHTRDMLGIAFEGHPDPRRWIRHQAWAAAEHPLRRGFPVAGHPPHPAPADRDYPFLKIQGSGVYEIPVGPVHAGIIEPGHFRFQAVGEEILALEERLGYVHKGIEKIAVGRDAPALARLAGRVSGDSTVAHAWAACQAMERAARITVPPRAQALRAVMAERERIANHLGDIGAICNDVGFAFAQYQFSRLREDWHRDSAAAFGHRFMMDRVVPGGVDGEPEATGVALLRRGQDRLRGELEGLYDILDDYPSLEDRLSGTGRLSPETAARIGVLGPVGRASGQALDIRHAHGYPPYDRLEVLPQVLEAGDVAARVQLRQQEILVSLDLLDRLLAKLPVSALAQPWRLPAEGAQGLGMVEGWRGEILSYVRFDAAGRIARFFPRDPSWFTWPALEAIVMGNIVPDFPVCNKSVNGSYSGHDL